ncbi:unnamed protein product [Trichobilharzia regenti]|nr:unnamed protein product [Trichobilharzia regenti]
MELYGFLKDLLELVEEDFDESDLDYTRSMILQNWDFNNDGKISLEEMRMLLLAYSSNDSRRINNGNSGKKSVNKLNSRSSIVDTSDRQNFPKATSSKKK